MPRIRAIKPEFFISEVLAGLKLETERTFSGLFTQADDCGRVKDSAAILNGALWPLRPEHTVMEMEFDLQALATAGLICRYEEAGKWLHIVNWDEHQVVNRPTPSKIPVCPTHGASKYDPGTKNGPAKKKQPAGATLFEGADAAGNSQPQRQKGRPAASGTVGAAATNTPSEQPDTTSDATRAEAVTGQPENLLDAPDSPGTPASDNPAAPAAAAPVEPSERGETRHLRSVPDLTGPTGMLNENTDTNQHDQHPTSTAENNDGTGRTGHRPDDEEDDMGIYDEPADPFAAPVVALTGKQEKAKGRRKAKAEQEAMYADDVEELCDYLADIVRENLRLFVGEGVARNVKVTKEWRAETELFLRKDGFTADQIRALIDWTAQDQFWRTNIRSMPTLRKQVVKIGMDSKFLRWAAANGRPTRAVSAAAASAVAPPAQQRRRAVDERPVAAPYADTI